MNEWMNDELTESQNEEMIEWLINADNTWK